MMTVEQEKMQTPAYILDIRNGKYSKTGAIAKLLKECGIRRFPVNPWRIARTLNFEVFETTFKNANISGMMIDAHTVPPILEKFNCKRAIIVNKSEPRNIQSFTIAHELGHFLYDCNDDENWFDAYHISKEKKDGPLSEKEQEEKKIEDMRDEFAAMLLMPESLFRDYVDSSENRDNKKALASELAKVCLVEEVAVEKRFEELGIEF